MAFNNKAMSGGLGGGGGTRFFTYKTSDNRAAVEAVGYLNPLYLTVKAGDAILASANGELLQLSVSAVDITAKTVTFKSTMTEGGA